MAGKADLLPHALDFLRVGKSHIGGVLQVVAGAVIAEGLSVALVALKFLSICNGLVRDGPAKIRVGGGYIADNHRGFDHGLGAAADDRNRVAQVAGHADGFGLAVHGGGDVFAIVAAEATQGGGVLGIVRIGLPVQVHVWEGGIAVNIIQGFDGRIDLGRVRTAQSFVRITQVLDGLEGFALSVVLGRQQVHGAFADEGQM